MASCAIRALRPVGPTASKTRPAIAACTPPIPAAPAPSSDAASRLSARSSSGGCSMHLTTPDSAVVTRRTDRRPALVSEMTTSLEGMMRRALCCAAACGLALATAPAARGDGLPVTGVDAGPDGVTNETSAVRYVTLKAGRGETLVARVMKDGGQVLRSRVLRPRFAIPAVALDATPSGLSADGRTLALIGPRRAFPQRRTRIALLDARTLRLRQVVTLRGDFSFDALSPDGRTMYLVEYLSRRDATRYAVRGFDVRAGRLLREPIVDPREPDERMRGMPITRATSPDGRWEYTLYDGAGKHPFVHALDTMRGAAACIDLDALADLRRLYELRLEVAGAKLRVLDGAEPLALIDRTTFRVAEPSTAPARAARDEGGASPLLPAGAAAALLLAFVTVRRRRNAHAGP